MSLLHRLSLLLAFALLTSAASAQSHFWNQDTPGNWGTASEWSPSGTVPNSASDFAALGVSGASPYKVIMNMNVLLDRLELAAANLTLELSSRELTINTGTTIDSSELMLINSTVKGGGQITNRSLISARGTSTIENLYNTGTVDAFGSSVASTGNLLLESPAYNEGIINVSSIDAGHGSNLKTGIGTTLSNFGTLKFLTGAGGSRSFNGMLDNNLAVEVHTNTTFQTGPISNTQNTFEIFPTAIATFGSNVDFVMNGGILKNDGAFNQSNADFTWNAGILQNIPPRLTNVDLTLNVNNLDNGVLYMQGSSTLTGIVRGGQTVEIVGANAGSTGNLTWQGSGDVLNFGTMRVRSEDGGHASNLKSVSGTRIVNHGVIEVLEGTGGSRTIVGEFLNETAGSIDIQRNTTMNTGPSFENKGSWTIASGATLSFSNNMEFRQTSGTFQIDGAFLHRNGIDSFNGGTVNGLVDLSTTNLTLGAGFTTPFTALVQGSSTLTGDIEAGQTLWARGSSVGSTATFNLAGATENRGDLVMDSVNGGHAANFGTSGIAFLNSGTFTVDEGAGGSRSIRGTLTNDGTVALNRNTYMNHGPVTNNGSWTIASGALMNFANSMEFEQNAGTFQIDGTFNHNNGTDRFIGGTVNGLVEFVTTNLTLDPAFTTPFTALVQGSSTLTGDIEAGQTLWARGSSSGSTATLNLAGATENRGDLIMDTTGGAYAVNVGNSGVSLLNTGTFTVDEGAGGSRNIRGTFTNDGTVALNRNTYMNHGPITNNGSWTIASGALMNFANSVEFEQNAGTFQIDGTFNHNNGTDRFIGGTVNGLVEFVTTNLTLDPAFTTPFTALVQGSSTLTGDIEAGQTLTARGSSAGSTANLNFAGATENRGDLIMDTTGGSYAVNVGTSGVSLLNTGTLTVDEGAGGSRSIRGTFTNDGTVAMNRSTNMNHGPVTNNGTWTIASGALMNFANSVEFEQSAGTLQIDGTFNHSYGTDRFLGGVVEGIPELLGSNFTLGAAFTDPSEFILQGTTSWTGDVEVDQKLWARGSNAGSTGNTTLQAPATNRGEIEVTSVDAGHASNLKSALGTDLSNEGTFLVTAGAGGSRGLGLELHNSGMVNIQTTTTIGISGAAHSNSGTFEATAPITLTGIAFTNEDGGRFESSSTVSNSAIELNNEGIMGPGPGTGTMTLTGAFRQGATGHLEIELGGRITGDNYDYFDIGGTAVLDGQLDLIGVNGFVPQFGQGFTILTASNITGAFTGLTYSGELPLGYGMEIVQSSTDVVVFVVQTILDGGAGSKVDVHLSDPVPGISGRLNYFQIDGATGGGLVAVVYGLSTGLTSNGVCAGSDFGIDLAQQLGTGIASATGTSILSVFVPPTASGVTAYFQALDVERCELSAVNSFQFP